MVDSRVIAKIFVYKIYGPLINNASIADIQLIMLIKFACIMIFVRKGKKN